MRACVVFLCVVCDVWGRMKKIRAWGEKQTNLQSVFLSSFFVSVLSEKTRSKNESIRVRQNKYIFSVYRPFSTIFENLAKRDKFWPDQVSNPGPQGCEAYHIPTTPTDQVTTYQFYSNIVTDVQSVCLQSTHKYKWKIFAGIFEGVYIYDILCVRGVYEKVFVVFCVALKRVIKLS